jgi:hypothetical protein
VTTGVLSEALVHEHDQVNVPGRVAEAGEDCRGFRVVLRA